VGIAIGTILPRICSRLITSSSAGESRTSSISNIRGAYKMNARAFRGLKWTQRARIT